MMNIFFSEHGHTLVELLIVAIILGLAIGTIFGIAEISLKISSEGNISSELREDTRNALHLLTREIRESSLATIFLGPSSTGPPYTAISLAHAQRDSSSGLICLDSNHNIIWDKVIIYHTYYDPGPGTELRRSVLDWNSGLTDAERQAQVNSYVNNPGGLEIIKNLQADGAGLLNLSAEEYDHWLETDFSHEDIEKDETLIVSGGNVFLDGGSRAWFVESQSGTDIPEDFNNSGSTPSSYRIRIKSDYIFKSGSKVKFKFVTSSTGTGDYGLDITSPSLAETDSTNPRNIVESTRSLLYFGGSTSKTLNNNQTLWTDWLSLADIFDKKKNYSLTYYASDTIYSIENFNVRKWVDGTGIDPTPIHEYLWSGDHSSTLDWDENGEDQTYLCALEEIEVGYCSSGTLTSQIYNTGVDNPTYTTISGNATVPTDTDIKIKVRSSDDEDMSGAIPWDDENIREITFTDGSNSHDISAESVNDIGQGRYVQFQATLTSPPPTSSDPYSQTPVLKDVTLIWQGGIITITVDRYYNYRGKGYSVSMTSDAKPKNK